MESIKDIQSQLSQSRSSLISLLFHQRLHGMNCQFASFQVINQIICKFSKENLTKAILFPYLKLSLITLENANVYRSMCIQNVIPIAIIIWHVLFWALQTNLVNADSALQASCFGTRVLRVFKPKHCEVRSLCESTQFWFFGLSGRSIPDGLTSV